MGKLFRLAAIVFLVLTSSTLLFAQAAGKKEWTMLVFLNGDNNLENAGYADIQEMEKIGSSEAMNIVVQFDTQKTSDGVRRYLIEKNPNPEPYDWKPVSKLAKALNKLIGRSEQAVEGDSRAQIYSPVVEQLSELDMGDWQVFRDFVLWGMEKYPADHYFVAIWNHGSGWSKRLWQPPLRGISYDDTDGSHISTPQLRSALEEIYAKSDQKIDVLGFDACLMQMVEVIAEVRNYVNYMVGSEETEPFDGWPYDEFLKGLDEIRQNSAQAISPQQLVTVLVQKYLASYNGGSQGNSDVTLSAVNMEKLADLIESLNDLVLTIINDKELNASSITDSLYDVQDYYYREYKDLYHFAQIISEKSLNWKKSQMFESSVRLMKSIDEMVAQNGYVGSSMKNSHGISINLPTGYGWKTKRSAYAELEFAKLSMWDEFLDFLGVD